MTASTTKSRKPEGPKVPTPEEVEKLVPELRSHLATAAEATEKADEIKAILRLLPDGEYLDGELVLDTPTEVDLDLFKKVVDEPTRLMVSRSILPTHLLPENLLNAAGVKHEIRSPDVRRELSAEKIAPFLRLGTKRVKVTDPKDEGEQ